jgi:hypothetical protein
VFRLSGAPFTPQTVQLSLQGEVEYAKKETSDLREAEKGMDLGVPGPWIDSAGCH